MILNLYLHNQNTNHFYFEKNQLFNNFLKAFPSVRSVDLYVIIPETENGTHKIAILKCGNFEMNKNK